VEPQLGQDALDMHADGALCDDQLFGDLAGAQPVGDEYRDLLLTSGQGVAPRALADSRAIRRRRAEIDR
jgi:hypothetical protein